MAKKKNPAKTGSLLLIISSSFILISLFSYLTNWKFDQDQIFNFQNTAKYLFSDAKAHNLGGRLGAVISHILVYQWIGIYAFLLVGYTFYYALQKLRNRKISYFSSTFFAMIVFILFACPLTSYFTAENGFPWGGGYGSAVTNFLTRFLGRLGSGLVMVGGFVVYLYYNDFGGFAPKMGGKVPALAGNPETISESDIADDESIESPKEKSQPISSAVSRFFQKVKEPTFATDTASIETQDSEMESNAEENPDDEFKIELKTEDLVENTDSNNSSPEQQDQMPDWLRVASEEVVQTEQPTKADTVEDASNVDDATIASPISETASKINRMFENSSAEESSKDDTVEGIYFEPPVSSNSNTKTDDLGVPPVSIKVAQESDEIIDESDTQQSSQDLSMPYDPKADLRRYKYPDLDLLNVYKSKEVALDKEAIKANIKLITTTLENFNIAIDIKRTTATVGPTVTLYEIVPEAGVRISKIKNLEDDIALNLAALGIRIIAPIPGKGTIGIEVPNENRQMVGLRSILASEKFKNTKHQLPLALGKRIDNQNVVIDLAAMPHLLVAGATGQGKSVGINTILISLLYKLHPSQIKFVLIDPKKVELSVYRLIENHFLAKLPDEEEAIITDTKKVVNTLNSLCIEMDHRYDLLKSAGARNLVEYNSKFISRKLNPKNGHKYLPMIVLVIDEFADLIMTAGKEVESPIARLAQLARAVGIHLIVATQRPDTKVITGTIKANFPARIAFKVSSQFDSRTIMDTKGAEQLIGKGDMLLSAGGEVSRIQCAFVDTDEVERIVEFIGQQQGYPHAHELPEYHADNEDPEKLPGDSLERRDQLFDDCARLVVGSGKGSTSMLQRKFNLGYNRAGRIMDQMEAAGIVGPSTGGKAREVYTHSEMELEEILSSLP